MALFGFMKSVNERSAKTADVGEVRWGLERSDSGIYTTITNNLPFVAHRLSKLRKDDSMDNFAPLSDNYAPSATASATSSSTRSGNSSINSSANSSSSSLKTDGNKTLSPPGPPGPLSPMSTLREPSTTPWTSNTQSGAFGRGAKRRSYTTVAQSLTTFYSSLRSSPSLILSLFVIRFAHRRAKPSLYTQSVWSTTNEKKHTTHTQVCAK